MTAKGLLATLIRAKDGDDVTVEALCKTHDEGRETLTKAMRTLVEGAFVVKFKIQREKSEDVELEDGRTETKRGGSWYTTFTVDSIPFTQDDVAAMLEDTYSAGNVKAVRVEPAHLDPRKASSRPTAGKPSVGANSADTKKPQVGPTNGKPTVGRPTVGRSAAKKIKTGEEEDSLSGARDLRDRPGEREAASLEGAVPEPRGEQPEPGDRPGDRIARRWAAERQARGVFTSPDRVGALAREADALLAEGQSVERLEREVSVMADHPTWVSLVRHMESVRPVMAAAGGRGVRPRGPGEGLSAAARAILAQGSGL
ncbi:hypothetical protein [Streptomyces sp.]|uniref:hypothetical protein n=1 Tax=Streptomyces sp. TaxID=1931 RepID=UPI002811411F|nr:hypothetical protein [Streptomyces sp.]